MALTLYRPGGATVTHVPAYDGNGNITAYVDVGSVPEAKLSGIISSTTPSSGLMLKTGGGTLQFTGNNAYAGTTRVAEGTLLVDGTNVGTQGLHTVGGIVGAVGTATLGGNGTITTNAAVTVNSNGILAPGDSPGQTGVLTVSRSGAAALAFTTGAITLFELNGTTPGSNYDQLNIVGTVALTNAALSTTLGYAPALNDKFFIVNNDLVDGITGTFVGLPNASTFTLGTFGALTFQAQIFYTGDFASGSLVGGNDVVLLNLTDVPEPAGLALLTLAAALGLRRRRAAA